MSTKPEVCRHGDNPEECISCAMLARRSSKLPPPMANGPKPSPDWIATAAAKAAKDISDRVADSSYPKAIHVDEFAAIITAAIERNAKP